MFWESKYLINNLKTVYILLRGVGEVTGKCWTYKVSKETRNFSWIATRYDTRSYKQVSEEQDMAVNKMPQPHQYLHERRELIPTAFLFLITSPCRMTYLYNFRHINVLSYEEVALFSDRKVVFITRRDLITQYTTYGHKVRASLVQRMTANSVYSQSTH